MLDIQTEHLENHSARLTVTLDAERIEQAMRQAARQLSQKARIPGFRPGKAPYNVVLNLYGREYVLGEALERIGNDVYREALEATEIEPYAPGALEKVEEDGTRLIFVVPKRPETDLGDYRSVRVPYEVEEVTDEMVNQAMEDLRQAQAVVEKAERPVVMGDQVTMALLNVTLLDADEDEDEADDEDDEEAEEAEEAAGEVEESGDENDEDENDSDDDDEDDDDDNEYVIFHEHNYEFVLIEDPKRDFFPGFSQELIGLGTEDEKVFTLELPADYEQENLAGRTVECEVIIESVQSRTVPEWTDTLAETVTEGRLKTLLELRMDVRKHLEQTNEVSATNALIDDALDLMVKGATVHYPAELIEEYIDDLIRELEDRLGEQRLKLDDFLRITGRELNSVREQYREKAVWRAERALVLGELVRQEQLDVSEEDLLGEIDRISVALAGDQSEKFKQFLTTDESRSNISNRMATDRALTRLAAIAKGENPPVGPDPVAEAEPAAESLVVAGEAPEVVREPAEEAETVEAAEPVELAPVDESSNAEPTGE